MLRFFVFGAVGNEGKSEDEKDASLDSSTLSLKHLSHLRIFEERLGERWQVQLLYNLWEKLDEDRSGRLELSFVAFGAEFEEVVTFPSSDPSRKRP